MKICIVLNSEKQKYEAGVRIRYKRIQKKLAENKNELYIELVENIIGYKNELYDVYIISKCYDSRALLLAKVLKNKGKNVGIDLFDDYFSHINDSRFIRFRYWLKMIANECNFILCSTKGMSEVAESFAPNIPIHIMNDPAPNIDFNKLELNLDKKLTSIKNSKILNILWFGIGDNPNFPVGLSDLAAFGRDITHINKYDYIINIRILTNKRALTADNLSLLTCLSVPYQVEEWTEEKQDILLYSWASVCFIPVNSQNFSKVKSLNRAITALSSGVQVLSSGYHLYHLLDDFIYRDPYKLASDLLKEEPKFHIKNIDSFRKTLEKTADISQEVDKLSFFLKKFLGKKSFKISNRKENIAIVHGYESNSIIHKYTQKQKALSVASPFCKLKVNFDVCFQLHNNKLEVFIVKHNVPLISEKLKPHIKYHGFILEKEYFIIESLFTSIKFSQLVSTLEKLSTTTEYITIYNTVMMTINKILKLLFTDVVIYLSENSKRLCWSLDNIYSK